MMEYLYAALVFLTWAVALFGIGWVIKKWPKVCFWVVFVLVLDYTMFSGALSIWHNTFIGGGTA